MPYSPDLYDQGLKLAEKMKQALLQANLTQEEAASALGVSQNWISKSEIAERAMKFVEVEMIAKLYGKPLDFFTTQS